MILSECEIDLASEILKSIAHPIRLKILCFLIDGEKNVSEIEQQFGSTISNISQHLTVLRKASIINRRKEANFMFYSLKDENISTLIETIKGHLHTLVNTQLTHVYVIQCFANSGIIPLGRDADERIEFAINFYLKVR